jgi:hypothetical protein
MDTVRILWGRNQLFKSIIRITLRLQRATKRANFQSPGHWNKLKISTTTGWGVANANALSLGFPLLRYSTAAVKTTAAPTPITAYSKAGLLISAKVCGPSAGSCTELLTILLGLANMNRTRSGFGKVH